MKMKIFNEDLGRILNVLNPILGSDSTVLEALKEGFIETSPIRAIVEVVIDLVFALSRLIDEADDAPPKYTYLGSEVKPNLRASPNWFIKNHEEVAQGGVRPDVFLKDRHLVGWRDNLIHPNFMDLVTHPIKRLELYNADAADFFEQIAIAISSWIKNPERSPFRGDAKDTLVGPKRASGDSSERKRVTRNNIFFWRRKGGSHKGKRS